MKKPINERIDKIKRIAERVEQDRVRAVAALVKAMRYPDPKEKNRQIERALEILS